MSSERRGNTRRAVQVPGTICDDSGALLARCMLSDVSATGAKVVLESAAELPDEFVLVLSRGGAVRRNCHVVRRNGTTLGVRFVSAFA